MDSVTRLRAAERGSLESAWTMSEDSWSPTVAAMTLIGSTIEISVRWTVPRSIPTHPNVRIDPTWRAGWTPARSADWNAPMGMKEKPDANFRS